MADRVGHAAAVTNAEDVSVNRWTAYQSDKPNRRSMRPNAVSVCHVLYSLLDATAPYNGSKQTAKES